MFLLEIELSMASFDVESRSFPRPLSFAIAHKGMSFIGVENIVRCMPARQMMTRKIYAHEPLLD